MGPSHSDDRDNQNDVFFVLKRGILRLSGRWTIAASGLLDSQLGELRVSPGGQLKIDGSSIKELDSTGAWLLVRTKQRLEKAGISVTSFQVPERYGRVIKALNYEQGVLPSPHKPANATIERVIRIGRGTVHAWIQCWRILSYLGRVTVETVDMILAPKRNLRLTAIAHQIEETGICAIPIVGLLGFLVGVVLAYQGEAQLKVFGADIFTVNLVGVGILRELGSLITAIIVAGRSGSAFTAHLGTMRVNEEIDAMQTIGMNTVDTLVLPRVIGLVITLPGLTLFADLMGVIGGATLCYLQLDITVPVFVRQLREAVSLDTLMVGLIKAPVFALVISLVGCFEGFQVERNATSVGLLTTRSVVESVFLVIALDAAFSIIFSILGI